MPRYFFHIEEGEDLPDDEGTELTDATTARAQAIMTAGQILKDLGQQVWDGEAWTMTVVDETGVRICQISFKA
jgi:hypothetical protein